MATPSPRLRRRGDAHARPSQPRLDRLDDEVTERHRLRRHRREPDRLDEVDGVLDADHAEHRRGPRDPGAHPFARLEARTHLEDPRMPHPPLDRLPHRRLVPSGDVREGRRARPAAQELVRAPHCQIHRVLVEPDRQHADGVAQVPQHEPAGVMHDARDLRQVRDPRGLVRDVREQHDPGPRADDGGDVLDAHPGRRVGLDPHELGAGLGGDAFGDVAVGGEVLGVQDDLGALRAGGSDGGAEQLVEEHGRRVRHDRLAGGGAEADLADPVAEPQRQVHPLLVPAADEPGAPVVRDEPVDPLGGGAQRAPQGVAVEIGDDGALTLPGRDEQVTARAQRVVGVELGGAVAQVHRVSSSRRVPGRRASAKGVCPVPLVVAQHRREPSATMTG